MHVNSKLCTTSRVNTSGQITKSNILSYENQCICINFLASYCGVFIFLGANFCRLSFCHRFMRT